MLIGPDANAHPNGWAASLLTMAARLAAQSESAPGRLRLTAAASCPYSAASGAGMPIEVHRSMNHC